MDRRWRSTQLPVRFFLSKLCNTQLFCEKVHSSNIWASVIFKKSEFFEKKHPKW
jgi:hypothetical protein